MNDKDEAKLLMRAAAIADERGYRTKAPEEMAIIADEMCARMRTCNATVLKIGKALASSMDEFVGDALSDHGAAALDAFGAATVEYFAAVDFLDMEGRKAHATRMIAKYGSGFLD
jgi:hypothetical protein